MAAMFTKLARLHALFLLCICPFVLCTLPSIPDSAVTGTLNRGVRVSREPQARRAREAREKNVFLASLPSLALRFQPPSRPFV